MLLGMKSVKLKGFHGDNNPSTIDHIPTMLSASQSGFVITWSSELNTDYRGWKAFRDTTVGANTWHTVQGTTTGWLSVQIPIEELVNKYTIQACAVGIPTDRAPKDWTLLGSTTGAFGGEEDLLDTRAGETTWTADEVRTFTFLGKKKYTYYRLNVTANDGEPYYLAIGEMELIIQG